MYVFCVFVVLGCWSSQALVQSECALQEAAVYLREGVIELQSDMIAQRFNESVFVQNKLVGAITPPREISIQALQEGTSSRAEKVLRVLMAISKIIAVSDACVFQIDNTLDSSGQLQREVQSDLMALKNVIHHEKKRITTLDLEAVEGLQGMFHMSRRKCEVSLDFLKYLNDLRTDWRGTQDGWCISDANFLVLVDDVLKEAARVVCDEANECQKRANLGLSHEKWPLLFRETGKTLAELMEAFGLQGEFVIPEISLPQVEQTWERVLQVFDFLRQQEFHKGYDLYVFSAYIEELRKKVINKELEDCNDENILQGIMDSCIESGLVRAAVFNSFFSEIMPSCKCGHAAYEWSVDPDWVKFTVCLFASADKSTWCWLYLEDRLARESKCICDPIFVNVSLDPIFSEMQKFASYAQWVQRIQDPVVISEYNQCVPVMQRLWVGVRELTCTPLAICAGEPTYANVCLFVLQHLHRAVASVYLADLVRELAGCWLSTHKILGTYDRVQAASRVYLEQRSWLDRALEGGAGVSSLLRFFLKDVTIELLPSFFYVMQNTALGVILTELAQHNERALLSGGGVSFSGYKQAIVDVILTNASNSLSL